MSKIHVLSEHLTNMIAAGEVVDRPANIVKECVENSMDAHAHVIDVQVYQGGIERIIITDDGDGMDHEDANLAFYRHATSKIQSEDDLFNIGTMGFRGEAIPSIASVAHVDLQTSNGKEGTHIIYDYGKKREDEKIDCPKGCKIDVSGLFIAIGKIPLNDGFKKLINLSDDGYVLATEDCHTNVPGIFVAGDVRKKDLRQLVTATSDGAVAASEAIKYINEEE